MRVRAQAQPAVLSDPLERVRRRSGLLRRIHLPDGHGPDNLCRSILPILEALPTTLRRSLTWDQGTEMARHDQLAHLFDDGIYFAYPASPWLRGS